MFKKVLLDVTKNLKNFIVYFKLTEIWHKFRCNGTFLTYTKASRLLLQEKALNKHKLHMQCSVQVKSFMNLILLLKIAEIDIRPNLCNSIKAFITTWACTIYYRDYLSHYKLFQMGHPQGVILNYTLYNIYSPAWSIYMKFNRWLVFWIEIKKPRVEVTTEKTFEKSIPYTLKLGEKNNDCTCKQNCIPNIFACTYGQSNIT